MESFESTRFCSIALLLLFIFLLSSLPSSLAQQQHEPNPTIRTMEDFSGYPIHEPAQFGSINLASSLSVDAQGLQKQIDELSNFSDAPSPSVTRVLYTDKDVLARRYVKNLMALADLSVREDAVGNIFGKWDGSEPNLPAVATGSHIDAIPYSGKYDGVVGVLGAIEAINVLKRSGFKPKRSLEIILFTSEEPTRFGISCLGSRLLAGSKELAEALKTTVVDGQNVSFIEAARSAGYAEDKSDDLSSVFLKKGSYFAFIELHIEQGPILEEEGLDIGVVTAIAAPASLKVEFEGNGGHAGAVLMPYRNDAGLAAAELALAVEKHVLESESIDTVGTVGILEIHPGAINSIPSKARLEIDTRDIDEARRNTVIKKIQESANSIARKRKVKLSEFKIVNQDPPALSDKLVIKKMAEASTELNLSHKMMISRAYHDSLFMARISPMGMIFIPCYKGYSHKPEEYSSPEDMANGVKVLSLTLAKLSLD
uniref:Ureidoglycolate hydrolase n=1 Tax=Noccaea caerulescens TaxID=107243 RepID=A0A1J3FFB3_NOCCA